MEFNLHPISILSKSLRERKTAFGREKETLRSEERESCCRRRLMAGDGTPVLADVEAIGKKVGCG
ncbi:uncharacterized protein G2W53_039782 [Senna tora]|uniref:Uncharacterized protein n=1 Tax=Senna tora TaxID=362788 RepID=A0A834W6G0_9FABA|nr:uncharacterized protein G2W53_039782 [Senna tora]